MRLPWITEIVEEPLRQAVMIRSSVEYAPGIADYAALKGAVEGAGYDVIDPTLTGAVDQEDVEQAAHRAEPLRCIPRGA
jgi:uncharacterized protein (UPF0264 family)